MKSRGSTAGLRRELLVLSTGGGIGIPGGRVKSVEFRKNTGGEGGCLAMY